MNIHFICRGNVLRSVIAETYLKSLNLENVNVISSGTTVDWDDPIERRYFARTLALLKTHRIESFAKQAPGQLTQARIDEYHDMVVFMNQRVLNEAKIIVNVPPRSITWGIVDIGEGYRTDANDLESYEERIYEEIVQNVAIYLPKIIDINV